MKKIETISSEILRKRGIQSLPNTPGSTKYGTASVSPVDLKAKFDQLAYLLADKLNEILEVLNNGSLGDYIPMNDPNHEIESLTALLGALSNGDVAKLLYACESVADEQAYPLQAILYRISEKISYLENGSGGSSGTASQAATVYTLQMPVSAWQEVDGRYAITTAIEGLSEQDLVTPRASHGELWSAFGLQVTMAEGAITASVGTIPAEDAVLTIAVFKTIDGGDL